MSITVPRFEPSEIIIGETLIWERTLLNYPPSDGWVLSYAFRGPGTGFNVTATNDGDVYEITVPAASTQAMSAGTYWWQSRVTKAGEVHFIAKGEATVIAGLAETTTSTDADLRSFAKKTLDAIDAMMAGKATADVEQYAIADRQLKHIPTAELIMLRKHYSELYLAELRRARGGGLRSINIGFDRPGW